MNVTPANEVIDSMLAPEAGAGAGAAAVPGSISCARTELVCEASIMPMAMKITSLNGIDMAVAAIPIRPLPRSTYSISLALERCRYRRRLPPKALQLDQT